jgi:hypothetical protein
MASGRQEGLISCAVVLMTAAVLPAEVRHGIGSWPERGHGNHRAVVRVTQPADAVWAHIEWRRRDRQPEKKAVLVFDANGQRVLNVVCMEIRREYGDVVFQPVSGPGTYYLYYLPYNPGVGNFDDPGTYFAPEDTASAEWRVANGLTPEGIAEGRWRALPRAELVEIQARGEFHRMDPMEVIATEQEVQALLAAHPGQTYLLFPEDRKFPIKMPDDLPYRWIQLGPRDEFLGEAQPNEYYCFQIGVWAARKAIPDIRLTFTDLVGPGGKRIPAKSFTCFNTEGIDWAGRPTKKKFDVAQGMVRALWIGVMVPREAKGLYHGAIRVQPIGAEAATVRVSLRVDGPVLADHGDRELWRMSRLRWLNSTLGLDDEVVPPLTPLKVRGDTVECILRSVRFGPTSLPVSIRANEREILAAPVEFVVETARGTLKWAGARGRVTKVKPAAVWRESTAVAPGLSVAVSAKMEADGCILYRVSLKPQADISVKDIRLELPIVRDVAKYMMGLGCRGGYRPASWYWKWDLERANNQLWIGDFDAGIQLTLQLPQDAWVSSFHETGLPESWHNDGQGGCNVVEEHGCVMVRAYTGARTLKAGRQLEFRFRFIVTPVKPIDPNHWNWRYGDVNADGNILHIHHATWENPYINYPFIYSDRLAETVRKVKSITTRRTDFGRLVYPAEGNINPDRGSLHIWARICFDPHAGTPGDARFNHSLFSLDWPNQDQLGFYWNIDDRGMRAYVREGAPERNQYPVLFGTHQPDWQEGQRHLLTLSWGDQLAIYVDGKLQGVAPYRGTLPTPLAGAKLVFQGDFALDAVKISDEPYAEDAAVSPTPDDHTLLLDTFSRLEGGSRTRPERIVSGFGLLTGAIDFQPGQYGKEIRFSFREVPAGPKGVNVYYTVRELSNHVVEMWALRSLGDEIFKPASPLKFKIGEVVAGESGGGYPWLQEHLVSGYVPAWRQPLWDDDHDAAILTQGLSRWHNYYIEGLRWLMENTGVDGLYLDGIGYDREIMKRVRKVMLRVNPNSRINFHCGNEYDFFDRRISPANFNLEHFPYISNLWFGEFFNYDRSPDYWLVEISGIPFGLTGEMLEYTTGGNPYRGMIYGMTGRFHPSAPAMWRFWDEFGIQEAEWLGYWSPKCPVRTDHPGVLATAYVKKGKTLIALAHWPEDRGTPKASAKKASVPPTIDGRLEAGEWDDAAQLARFTVLGTGRLPEEPMEAYVTWDDERLYLAFRCTQTGPLKADARERDAAIYQDDAVEFFLQPDTAKAQYFQFVGNSAGVFLDGKGQDAAWDGDWVYRAEVGEGYWQGEASITWASLGLTQPKPGQAMGFNVCRDRVMPSQEWSTWAPVQGTFHDPANFGALQLSLAGPSTREEPLPAGGPAPIRVRLLVDWKALALDPSRVRLTAPYIEHFQPPATFRPDQAIPIEPSKGWLLIAEEE